MTVRPAIPADADAIGNVLEPMIRAGEAYTLPHDWTREQALAFWLSPEHSVFVAEENGSIFTSASWLCGCAGDVSLPLTHMVCYCLALTEYERPRRVVHEGVANGSNERHPFMPSVKCQAILFDMDGTLVDSTACVEAT